MIKVYLVDDEKLVRRGIYELVEWSKYDMEVIGDSGSGVETIEFLKNEKVDLLFSDLEMPGLSGIDFLKEVKKICPKIQIVVLTMHQKFEFIQQGLRLGILDYVTKAQIEAENIDPLMMGIKNRYLEAVQTIKLEKRRIDLEKIYLCYLENKIEKDFTEYLEIEKIKYEIINDNYLMLVENQDFNHLNTIISQYQKEKGILIEVNNVKGISYEQFIKIFKEVIRWRLFADRKPESFYYSYDYAKLQILKPSLTKKELIQISTDIEFMVDSAYYKKSLVKIRDSILTKEERIAVFYHFNLYWSDFLDKDFTKYFEEVSDFKWWYQWEEWFNGIQQLILNRINEFGEEIAVMKAIHKAMNYIRENMKHEMSLEEILQLTGMSKSYFSKKFKKATGKTFITYLNDLRIETSKKYLLETTQPIYWIARQVGYDDEHYFRRVFKERTGLSPNRYRNKI